MQSGYAARRRQALRKRSNDDGMWMTALYTAGALGAICVGILLLGSTSKTKRKKRRAKKGGSEEDETSPPSVQGLKNIGNTCFMNSILQAMCNTEVFHSYLKSLNSNLGNDEFVASLLQCFQAVSAEGRGSSGVFNPKRFYKALTQEATQFSGYAQHDAHELLNYLLSIVTSKAGQVKRQPTHARINSLPGLTSLIESDGTPTVASLDHQQLLDHLQKQIEEDLPVTGYTTSFLQCRKCGYQSPARYSQFTSISLSMPHAQPGLTLHNLLKYFTISESLDGVNCEACSLQANVSQVDEHIVKTKSTRTRKTLSMYKEQLESKLAANLLDPQRDAPPNSTPRHAPPAEKDASTELGETFSPVDTSASPSKRSRPRQRKAKPPVVVRTAASKRIMFARLPPILCLHVSRLMGDVKIAAHVRFPLVLDMNPYFANTSREYSRQLSSHTTPGARDVNDQRRAAADFKAALRAAEAANNSPAVGSHNDNTYVLSAVVIHHGSALGGHYTTTRRVRPSLKSLVAKAKKKILTEGDLVESVWMHASDANVQPVNVVQVLSTQAYMLFYERV